MTGPLVFILTPEETFTPTRSGAIATHTHACCREAHQAGIEPIVLARPSEAPSYPDVQTVTFEYPAVSQQRAAVLMRRVERKVRQWSRLRYGAYVQAVQKTLHTHGLEQATLVIHNDPELVVALRDRVPKARLVHWFHNQHTCKPRPRAAFKRCVDDVVAVSEFLKQWVCTYYDLPEAAVKRVYNGVDTTVFCPRSSGDAASNGHGRPVINFTGRTGIEKAPDLVLAAALELVRRDVADFAVQLIGANHFSARTMDPYQQKLDALIEQLQAAGVDVRLLGHLDRDQTARHMQEADIHVVPSRWDEPFGLTTVEGMACGLPTVGSRTGATPEVLGSAGALFEADNAVDLADQLEPLIGDKNQRWAMGSRARRRAGEFTWDRTFAGLQAVLESRAANHCEA
jgi:glycosyltransferase involved in cell wall biosynthesis